MNKILRVGCALSLLACGRIEQGDEDDSVAATPVDCVYGPIATTSGPIGQLASAGGTLFVVNGSFAVSVSRTPPTFSLSAIAKDGTVSAVSAVPNPSDGVVPIGASLAFITRTLDDEGRTTTATLSLLNSNQTVTTVDSFTQGGPTYQINSPATDAAGSLYWYRWNKNPGKSPVEIMKRAPDGSITSQSPDPSFAMLGSLVTDGTNMFANAVTTNGEVFGRLALDGADALTIATSPSGQSSYGPLGFDDDDHLVYADWSPASIRIFAISKNGGASAQLASTSWLGSEAIRDHHFYWTDGSTITRVKTEGEPIMKIIATPSDPIETLTTDACGVVYATSDSSGASSIYRAQF